MPLPIDFGSIVRPLRHRGYAIYSVSTAASMTGNWLQRITVGWLAWELTRSGGWLGILAFADLFPTAVIGLVTGVLADRWGRMRLIRITQILSMLQAFLLFVFTATGMMSIWLLFALAVAQGFIIAFNQPVRSVVIASLVPREDLASAVAMNAIIFNTARFIGPALAGVIIATSGVAASFAANFLAFAVSTYALFKITMAEPGRGEKHGTILSDLVEGLRYTIGHPGILPMLFVMTALGLGVRPVVELLPGIADAVFNAGVGALATLTSAMGVGSVIAGLWMGSRSSKGNLFLVTLWQCVIVSAALLLFITSSSLTLGIPLIALVSFAMTTTAVTSQTAIQLAVTPEMAGRVMGIHVQNFRGAPALGALIMGFASEFVGLRWPFVAGAVVILATCLLAYWKRGPIIEALESGPRRETPPE